MIGGEPAIVAHLDPIFATLAPGQRPLHRRPAAIARRSAPPSTATCTAARTAPGHFVKMIHNGIEYGVMAAYAEGLNVLKHANIGVQTHEQDAETAPVRHPAHYRYDFDIAAITELWRRGSVVSSWLLDLTAAALAADPACSSSRAVSRIPAKGDGPLPPPSTRGCRRRC